MDTQLKLFSLSVFLFFILFFILTSKFRWTRTLAASVMFPFPHFFFFLNRCTYEFANFYVIYIYIYVLYVCVFVQYV